MSIKEKIRASNAKKREEGRAHARKSAAARSIAKVVKKAASIAELLTADDQLANLDVIRRAKEAKHPWYDPQSKTTIWIPDMKTQMAGVVLDLAYTEGKPVDRSLIMTGTVEEFGKVLGRMSESPEAKRMLQAIDVDSLPSGQNVASDEGATREEP